MNMVIMIQKNKISFLTLTLGQPKGTNLDISEGTYHIVISLIKWIQGTSL